MIVEQIRDINNLLGFLIMFLIKTDVFLFLFLVWFLQYAHLGYLSVLVEQCKNIEIF